MQNIDLSGLKDIHPPIHELGIFPLAIGWWIVIFAPIVIFLICKVFIYLKHQTVKFYAMRELNQIIADDTGLLNKLVEVSMLLKRLAIKHYGQNNVADLHGKQWAEFLCNKAKYKKNDVAEIIASSAYLPDDTKLTVNIVDVKALAVSFIRFNT